MLQHAFKEWAVICDALGRGQQAFLLRKGGIAEDDGEFRIEQTRFWLYPTYAHQQNEGISEEAKPLLAHVLANRPPTAVVRLQLWAEVAGIYRIREELPALLLSHLHYWSEETVRKRFNYRVPELHLLVVRVHRLPKAHEFTEIPAYAGCRSWVELEKPLSTEGSVPVLSDADFHLVQKQVDLILSPTAFA